MLSRGSAEWDGWRTCSKRNCSQSRKRSTPLRLCEGQFKACLQWRKNIPWKNSLGVWRERRKAWQHRKIEICLGKSRCRSVDWEVAVSRISGTAWHDYGVRCSWCDSTITASFQRWTNSSAGHMAAWTKNRSLQEASRIKVFSGSPTNSGTTQPRAEHLESGVIGYRPCSHLALWKCSGIFQRANNPYAFNHHPTHQCLDCQHPCTFYNNLVRIPRAALVLRLVILRRQWQLNDINNNNNMSYEDKYALNIYVKGFCLSNTSLMLAFFFKIHVH